MPYPMSKKTADRRVLERFGKPPAAPIRAPLTIRVSQGANEGILEVTSPRLVYRLTVPFEGGGDGALCAATTRALTSLIPERVNRLRREGQVALSKHGSKGMKPKLLVVVETTSRTFRNAGVDASSNTKTVSSDAALKLFQRQLRRFEVRWVLLPSAKPKPEVIVSTRRTVEDAEWEVTLV